MFSLEFPNELAGSTITPIDSHEALLGPWLSQCRPGERWHPRGPSQRSYTCLGRVPACGLIFVDGGAFDSLCGGVGVSWRWVPSRASPWLWVLKSRTAGFWRSFLRPSFVAIGFCTKSRNCLRVHVRGHAETERWWLSRDEGSLGKRVLSSVHPPYQVRCEFQSMLVWVDCRGWGGSWRPCLVSRAATKPLWLRIGKLLMRAFWSSW